jgi:hypothetical protein
MNYTTAAAKELYLLTTLQFQLGSTEVKLYGGVRLDDGELRFCLSDKLDSGLTPSGLSPATESIAAPFGMTGIMLDRFDAVGQIYKDTDGATAVNLALNARTKLQGLGLSLDGSLVFEKASPRLVVVTLTADHPLTLTDFVESVLGGSWHWVDDLTKQIAFQEGRMYYLSSASAFQYPATTGVTYTPGYHIAAKLRLFEKYAFDIVLDVEKNGEKNVVTVTGGVPELDFDFVTFQKPQLQICTKPESSYFRISTDIVLLGTSIASVEADYSVKEQAFGGRVSRSFDVDIPAIGGTSSGHHVDLAVSFVWTSGAKGGFKITDITGLPANVFDLAREFEKYLNDIKSGGCEKILGDWLKDLCKTTLSPGFDGPPKKQDGQMLLPLKLTYTISLGGQGASSTIGFTAQFEIPRSLSGLPAAMWGWAVTSVPDIVGKILGDPNTYKALALACAIKYGAAAGARFICRALETVGKDVAQSIADAAAGFAASDIAATAELAAAIAGITVAVVGGIIEEFLDFLKHLLDDPLGIKKRAKEKEDNARINAQADKIRAALKPVWDKVAAMEAAQAASSLKTAIDRSGNFSAVWTEGAVSGLPAGAAVEYRLSLLGGAAGDKAGSVWPGTEPYIYTRDRTSATISLSKIPNPGQFGLNASITGFISGIIFLTSKAESDLSTAIGTLNGVDLDSARALANQLGGDLRRLKDYNTKGVRTAPVYAVLDMPALMTVGQSRIGRNTRIRSK